jgi:SAM-dependent methyltransferase
VTDKLSLLDRLFPSRATKRSIQSVLDQISIQNQILQEMAERATRHEEQLAATNRAYVNLTNQYQTLSDNVRRSADAMAATHDEELATTNRAHLNLTNQYQMLVEDVRRSAEAMAATHALLDALQNAVGQRPSGAADGREAHIGQRLAEAQLWLEKISTETQSAFAHVNGAIQGVRGDVGTLANQIAEVRLWLAKISSETQNALVHLDGRVVTGMNRLFNEAIPETNAQAHTVAALLLEQRARAADRSRWRESKLERYAPAKPEDFEKTLQNVARDFPNVSSEWRTRLDVMINAFSVTKTGNAANASDLYSSMFRSFVETHVEGRVLDVGCGVFGRPYYLEAYPANLISGIDPLEMLEAPDFEFTRGMSEYLPWPDGSFSTVINATSLDHVVSLTVSLDEMSRVLRPGGVLLLWIGSTKGSPRYDPESPQFVPADEFHLFHFDTAWFEPMLEKDWAIVDRMEFPTASFEHVFYALRPIKRAATKPVGTTRSDK